MPQRSRHAVRGFEAFPATHVFYRQDFAGTHLAAIAEGVLAEALRSRCEHHLLHVPEKLTPAMLRMCRGIVAPYYDDMELHPHVKAGTPVVNISNSRGTFRACANVISDDVAVGRLAARHLASRGCRVVLVVRMADRVFSEERSAGLQKEAARLGIAVREVETHERYPEQHWGVAGFITRIAGELVPTIEALPHDAGIFAVNDAIGWALLRMLEQFLPDRVFTMPLLAADNTSAHRPTPRHLTSLSSVQPAFREVGARALKLVIEAKGDPEAIAGRVVRIPPPRVVERASTAGSACADPLTARIVRTLWTRLREGLPVVVEDVAREHGMTRRTLERRFGQFLGTTARDFLAAQRIAFARQLLAETTDPIGSIATSSGFAEPAAFSSAFRKATGLTPSEFRGGTARALGGGPCTRSTTGSRTSDSRRGRQRVAPQARR